MEEGMDNNRRLFAEERRPQSTTGIVLGSLHPSGWFNLIPQFLQTWIGNYVGGSLIYFLAGFLWCFYIYYLRRDAFVPKVFMQIECLPGKKAMPWNCLQPTIFEYMIENGWTKCFSQISAVGWPTYLIYLATYLVLMESGIYWTHRESHDLKLLYKYLHVTHHAYNKKNSLSPFADNSPKLIRRFSVTLSALCAV